jgi:hypothetical protein
MGDTQGAIDLYERVVIDPTCKLKYLKEYLKLSQITDNFESSSLFKQRTNDEKLKLEGLRDHFKQLSINAKSTRNARYFQTASSAIERRLTEPEAQFINGNGERIIVELLTPRYIYDKNLKAVNWNGSIKLVTVEDTDLDFIYEYENLGNQQFPERMVSNVYY